MIWKLKALKRCQAVAALVKDYATACWSQAQCIGEAVLWARASMNSGCSGLLLWLGAGENGISQAAPSVTADVQLETFPKAASSAYECLDFVSVRRVPQKFWSYPAKKCWWVLPAHTKLGAGVCPPVPLQCTLQKVCMSLDLTNQHSILLIAGNCEGQDAGAQFLSLVKVL